MHGHDDSTELLTVSEFAVRVGCTPETVREWDRRGSVPAFRRNGMGSRLYREEQVAPARALLERSPVYQARQRAARGQ